MVALALNQTAVDAILDCLQEVLVGNLLVVEVGLVEEVLEHHSTQNLRSLLLPGHHPSQNLRVVQVVGYDSNFHLSQVVVEVQNGLLQVVVEVDCVAHPNARCDCSRVLLMTFRWDSF